MSTLHLDDIIGELSPDALMMIAIDQLTNEVIPREGEIISGQEMLEAVREYFGAEEIDVMQFPLTWLLDSLASDDVDRVTTAALVNGILYVSYKQVRATLPYSLETDYAYHTFAALRIRLECRFAELTSDEPSQFITRIN